MSEPSGRSGQHGAAQRRAERAERQGQVWDLVKAGANMRQVASTLGVSYATVRRDVDRVLSGLARETMGRAEQFRALHLARLDDLYLGMVRNGGSRDPVRVDRLLRIMERQAKLLGLDAPQRVEQSGPAGGPIRVDLSTDAELAAYARRPVLQLARPPLELADGD